MKWADLRSKGHLTSTGVGTSSSPSSPMKTCSCPCWGKVEALNQLVTDLSREIEKHTQFIAELQEMSRVYVAEKQEKQNVPQLLPTPLTTSDSEVELEKDEGFDIHQTCEVTEVVGEEELPEDTQWMDEKPEEVEIVPSWPKIIRTEGSVPATVPLSLFNNESVNDFQIDEQSDTSVSDSQPASEVRIPGNAVVLGEWPLNNRISTPDNENPEDILSDSSCSFSSLVCSMCTNGHVFRNRSLLRRHIRHFHTGPPRFYACKQCDRVFQYKEGLTYHMQSVHQGIRYLCGQLGCKSAYSTITALRKHQRLTEHNTCHKIISLAERFPKSKYKPQQLVNPP